MKKLTDERDILDESFRKQVIKEIVNGDENLARKSAALKRHEIYRDKNKKWVIEAIKNEGFKTETVARMANRATNISIAKKIVNKKAVTYVGGVERTVGTRSVSGTQDPAQEAIDAWSDELDLNTRMKKTDRYRELFKNVLVGCLPVQDSRERTETSPKSRLKVKVLAAWEYDVIEDPKDPEKPAVIILTDFPERRDIFGTDQEGAQGIRSASNLGQASDGIDQAIADRPEDRGADPKDRRFVWWSDTYHFTTNMHGQILSDASPEGNLNPIGRLPWVDIHDDQDGNFWAAGGDDVIEGSILINKKLTDLNFILFVQGWGQLVIAAERMPDKILTGPDNALLFEKSGTTGDVQVFFTSANPNIEGWLETARMTLAMLLSTNNLSVRNIAVKLDAAAAASGIALMIENSEVVSDLSDVQELFRDKEPVLWEIIQAWQTLYLPNGWLVADQAELPIITDANVSLKFVQTVPPISAKEHLEELKLRKEIGIATLKDLIKRDNPDLSSEEVDAKALELASEGKAAVKEVAGLLQKDQANGIRPGIEGEDDGEDSGDEVSQGDVASGQGGRAQSAEGVSEE